MNQKLDIVITMGGLGSRFRKSGYKVPKYMIEAKFIFEMKSVPQNGETQRSALKGKNNSH